MFQDIFKDKKKTLMIVVLVLLLLFTMTKRSQPKRVEVPVQQVVHKPVVHQQVVQQPVVQQPVVQEQRVVEEQQVVQEENVGQEQVQETFNQGKNNMKTKATLYWASWCGHCQMTKPKWMEMKKHFSGKSGIEIEEVNCEGENYKKCVVLNEQGKPDNVRGYPTMVVRKINENNLIVKEVEYEPNKNGNIRGDRSTKDLINFVNYYNKVL